MSIETAKYMHKSQYDKCSSVSFKTSKAHKIGILGGLGGSAMGAKVGVGINYEHNRNKEDGKNTTQVESKELTVEIHVPINTAIVVKEIVYYVEKIAECTLELVLNTKDEIPYTYTIEKEKSDKLKVKDLWSRILCHCSWAREEDDSVICTFTCQCCLYTTEHRLETIRLKSDEDRCKRIIAAYEQEQQM